jgi:hypothetical protein
MEGMEPFYEIAKKVVELLNALLGMRSTLSKESLESRIRVAQYLEHISECLDAITEAGVNGEIYSSCAELREYLRSLDDVIGKEIGEDNVARYITILQKAVNSRSLWLTLHDPDDLIVLRESSGRSRAFANRLRV